MRFARLTSLFGRGYCHCSQERLQSSGRKTTRDEIGVGNLERELEDLRPSETTGAPALKARKDAEDSPHRIGKTPWNRESLDERLEKVCHGIPSIFGAIAGLFERLEQKQRPQERVVERSFDARATIDVIEESEDARAGRHLIGCLLVGPAVVEK